MINSKLIIEEMSKEGLLPPLKMRHFSALAILFEQLEDNPELMQCLLKSDLVAEVYSEVAKQSRDLEAKQSLIDKLCKFKDSLSQNELEIMDALRATGKV